MGRKGQSTNSQNQNFIFNLKKYFKREAETGYSMSINIMLTNILINNF